MCKNRTGSGFGLTFVAESPIIGRVRAIAGVAMVFLYAFASIFTVGAIAGAMA
jgi:hypothetical protein